MKLAPEFWGGFQSLNRGHDWLLFNLAHRIKVLPINLNSFLKGPNENWYVERSDRKCLSALVLPKAGSAWIGIKIFKGFHGSVSPWLQMRATYAACVVPEGDRGCQVVCLHLEFRGTSLAHLRVTKGNMCYVPAFHSLNKACPHLSQIDVWSIYLDPVFAI